MDLEHNLSVIQQRILAAEQHFNRRPGSVSLIAASKTQPDWQIANLAKYGQYAFAENYVQEALRKISALKSYPLIWHFIGRIQSNKANLIAQHFDWVHTVSRFKDAQLLAFARGSSLSPLNICIQVKVADSDTKGGVYPEDVPSLQQAIQTLPHLTLRGLMAIPPQEKDFAKQRHYFRIVSQLFNTLNQKGAQLDTLSMGMTEDLEAAIAEGSTLVRVGTGLFGPRKE